MKGSFPTGRDFTNVTVYGFAAHGFALIIVVGGTASRQL
jgi:hypothetical protein